MITKQKEYCDSENSCQSKKYCLDDWQSQLLLVRVVGKIVSIIKQIKSIFLEFQ